MTVTWFCFFHHDDPARRVSEADRRRLIATIGACPGLERAHVHTPSPAAHPYADLSVAPMLALELQFAMLADCEAALADRARLGRLAERDFLPSLAGASPSQQGMLARLFPGAGPDGGGTAARACTYLVDYPGPAEDLQAWLGHYLGSHARIMDRLPGIRVAAVYTPAVVVSGLPFRFATAMLRNKVVFDSAEALERALASPVRAELRADVEKFPPYSGDSKHVPMETVVVTGASA